jgi:hypothetical protein
VGHFYELSGVRLESDLRLASLGGESAIDVFDAAPLVIRVRVSEAAVPATVDDWMLVRPAGDEPWFFVARRPGGYLLRIRDCADFLLDASGTEVVCVPVEGCALDTLEQALLDQIFPFVLHACGRFSFHASSVAVAGCGVLAFLGISGSGKSTLASSLARAGFASLFSDDCLAVTTTASGILAHPSYPSSRLWPPSAEALFRDRGDLPFASPRTSKRRVALPAEQAVLPLQRVYLLDQGDCDPVITRLRRRDALASLAAHLYRLDFEDRTRLTEEVSVLEQVVTQAIVARLAYRRDFAELSAVYAAIRADMESSRPGPDRLPP